MSEAERDRDRLFKGRAVRDGRLIFSSVSQVKLFDARSEGCPRKWAFQYVFGRRVKKTGALLAGADFAAKLEHYFKTSEDVLPPVLQIAKKFLPALGADIEVERPLALDDPEVRDERGAVVPGGGFLRAIAARESYLRTADEGWLAEARKWAGLTAAGVPIDGAADFRHFRGEYLDEAGALRREASGAVVCETVDLKTTSRIDPQKIRRGPNAGATLPGRAKTPAQICADAQMLGYAKYVADREHHLTHVRLSHVYAQTKGKKAAKRTGIISVEEVRRRWRDVESVVWRMQDVAGAARIEDVEPNTSACDAFTHVDAAGKTQKGCAHRLYCPLSASQVAVNMIAPYKEDAMSLFDQLEIKEMASGNGAPLLPAPPLDDAAHAAAVEVEKRRLLEQDAARVAPLGDCRKCGAPLTGENTSKLTSGLVKHVGCSAEWAAPPPPPSSASAPSTPAYNPSAVVPPDAPGYGDLDAAAALPQEEIDRITDPAFRKQVEEHAARHRAIAEAEEKRKIAERELTEASTYCSGSNQRVRLTVEVALSRKMKCASCGKETKLKPAKEGEDWFATVPRHKLAGGAGGGAAPPAVSPSSASSAPPAAVSPPSAPPASPAPFAAPFASAAQVNALAASRQVDGWWRIPQTLSELRQTLFDLARAVGDMEARMGVGQ